MWLGGTTVTMHACIWREASPRISCNAPSVSRSPSEQCLHITRPPACTPIGLEGQPQVSQSADSEPMKKEVEENDRRSGSENIEGGSGDDQDPDRPPQLQKSYHGHTPRQIREMERVFKECPRPDEKQRQELSKDLGLQPRQVKFWFQGMRTQLKAREERSEKSMLRAENEKLRVENASMREAIKTASCSSCGGPAKMYFDEQCPPTSNN